jgi:alanine racemase
VTSPSTALQSRAWVEIDLDALRRNVLRLQRIVGADVGLVPMVKADAYGLGMEAVVAALRSTLSSENLWAFGVATVSEGETLRELGWTGRVLAFSPAPPTEYPRAAAADLTLCLSDVDAVRRWAATAREVGRRLVFHSEIDTGMGRAGFQWDRAGEWGASVADAMGEHLQWQGCFTHYHSADEAELGPTDVQWERFRSALASLAEVPGGPAGWVIHSSNSAATLRRAGYGCDLVRPGIFLYGGSAGPGTAPEPVVTIRARVALIREVAAGSTLGYGATYTARRPERWGTLAIGYGDGLPRALGAAGGAVLVRGRHVPIIGRISMDVTTVDLTDVPDAMVGDVATPMGRDGEAEIRVDQVAEQCGTISYEILTGLTRRLPRIISSRDAS